MTSLRKMIRLVPLLACMLPLTWLQAADYPTKSIRLIVPFVAGGGTDILARTFRPGWSSYWVNRSWWTIAAAPAA